MNCLSFKLRAKIILRGVLALALIGSAGRSPAADVSFAPLIVEKDKSLENGMQGDDFVFADASGRPRSALMLPNDRKDAFGLYGGCMHRLIYQTSGGPRTCAAQNRFHPGFGYTVNHFSGSSVSSRFFKGTYDNPFVGRHHAFRTYHWQYAINGQNVGITMGWFFVSGRDNIVYAISYDLSQVPQDKLIADTRAPYGDLSWDGGVGADVEGLGWGDRFLFRTLGQKVTEQTGWSYDLINTTHVPHVVAWTQTPDAEMGVVQTETYERHDAGGYTGWRLWGQRSESGPMPDPTVWPFQLNQYELPITQASKRMAWGSNYGAIGLKDAPTYGDAGVQSGWPFVSYSTFVVLGPHSTRPTWSQAQQVSAQQRSLFVARQGATVALEAAAGVGRQDKRVLATPGLDPVWSVWKVAMDKDAMDMGVSLTVPKNEVLNDVVFEIDNYVSQQLPVISKDDQVLEQDKSVLVSINHADKILYITVPGEWRGTHTLDIKQLQE